MLDKIDEKVGINLAFTAAKRLGIIKMHQAVGRIPI